MLGECSELVVYTKGMLRPNNRGLDGWNAVAGNVLWKQNG